MKQARLANGTMPPSTAAPTEGSQPVVKVGPIVVGIVEIAPTAPSSVLVKRKRDDGVGLSGRKKPRDPSCPKASYKVDTRCGSPFKCARCASDSTNLQGSWC